MCFKGLQLQVEQHYYCLCRPAGCCSAFTIICFSLMNLQRATTLRLPLIRYKGRAEVCFNTVIPLLQDPGMQELLPFGEYVSPEQTQSAQNLFMGQFEAWELERILARLAVSNGGHGLNTGRRRGQPRAEPVNGELPGSSAGTAWLSDCGWLLYALNLLLPAFLESLPHHTAPLHTSYMSDLLAVERPGADAGSSSGPKSGAPSDQAAASDGFIDEASYPSSWPPNSARGKPQAVGTKPMHAGYLCSL